VLDVYFRQCSVLVTARDLAVMAATLANSGVNPAAKPFSATLRVIPNRVYASRRNCTRCQTSLLTNPACSRDFSRNTVCPLAGIARPFDR